MSLGKTSSLPACGQSSQSATNQEVKGGTGASPGWLIH